MLARFEGVDGDRGMHVVGHADAYRVDSRIGQQSVVIVISFGDFMAFRFGFEFVRLNIAQGDNFRFRDFGIGVGVDRADGSAADDSDSDFAHDFCS